MTELQEIFARLRQMEQILCSLYNPEIKDGLIPRIEQKLDDHLAIHKETKVNIGDRVFKIFSLAVYAVLIVAVSKLWLR